MNKVIENDKLIDAVYRELPWIEWYYVRRPKKVKIMDLDPTFLETMIHCSRNGDEGHWPSLDKSIDLITGDGKRLGRVGTLEIPEKMERRPFLFWFTKTVRIARDHKGFDETVADALLRLDPCGKAHYLVGTLGYDELEIFDRMIITKLPPNILELARATVEWLRTKSQLETKAATEEIRKTLF